eukprot:jgi/Tetstr1/436622/TSEL_025418.t1
MVEARLQCRGQERRVCGESVEQLRTAAREAFAPLLDAEAFSFATSSATITCDSELSTLTEGELLFVVSSADQTLLDGSVKERINFVPHPKTLTHAGDYEYFADKGQHPLPYAIAELVDNSLQATRQNHLRGVQRDVEVTFLVGSRGGAFISVWDNGRGMTAAELGQWAVMNLAVADRQAAATVDITPSQAVGRGTQREPPPAERYLSGELSYFGVGSKNASFFMGRFVKVQTKSADSCFVHELCLRADNLEQRYRDGQPVYEEDLVHRNPGDASSLSELEQAVPSLRKWVQLEGEGPSSFTRVTVGMLKDSITEMIADSDHGARLCDELAHLYHYYLHGSTGNLSPSGASQQSRALPGGQLLPHITLQYVHYSRDLESVLWTQDLKEVDTDMESLYLRKKKAEFKFSLHVPDKGVVDGVLYYFPYENGAESLPADKSLVKKSADVFTLTQQQRSPDGAPLTQGKAQCSQAAPLLPAECVDGDEGADEDGAARRRVGPVLSTFWQGRLIPATRIESLPFIEATRAKRSAAARDILPDEVFSRLRGALFFGPNFLVTRNKLNFRDNLQDLLAGALPMDRNLERRFREWLTIAHQNLDKNIRFESMASSQEQAAARKAYGENVTLFHNITDNSRIICSGNVVRLATRPIVIGRVVHFRIGQIAHGEGCYSNGLVQVAPLPEEVFGKDATFSHQLRRIEEVLTEEEAEEHCARELSKMPAKLCVDPMRLSAGKGAAAVPFAAGDTIPETSITVLSQAGARITSAYMAGQRRSLAVTQTLYFLPGGQLARDPVDADMDKENRPEEAGRPLKKRQKGKGKAQNSLGAAEAPPAREELLEVFNKQPNKEAFVFQRVQQALTRAGTYELEYRLTPDLPSGVALCHTVQLEVAPGPPTGVQIQGEGRAFAMQNELHMGEPLPPVTLTLTDDAGNTVPLTNEHNVDLSVSWPSKGSDMKPIPDVMTEWEGAERLPSGGMTIRGLRLVGPESSCFGVSIFDQDGQRSTQRSVEPSQVACSQAARRVRAADVVVLLRVVGGTGELPDVAPALLELSVRPGLPAALAVCPGHPFEEALDEATGEAALSMALQLGAPIPPFQLTMTDRWNNPTGASDRLAVKVRMECTALQGSGSEFAMDARGASTVEVAGLQAASHMSLAGASSVLRLLTICTTESESLEQCIAVHPTRMPSLSCTVEVEKKAVGAGLQLLWGGEKLPLLEGDGVVGGEGQVFVIKAVEAGGLVEDLGFEILDQDGNRLATPAKGKLSTSWVQGSKKLKWQPDEADYRLPLPALQAPECVAEPATCWVRVSLDKAGGGAVLECELQVHARPSAPASWGISVVGTGITTQDGADLSCLVAGEPCCLEVEALDRFHNRCTKGSCEGGMPTPTVSIEGSPELEYNPKDWEGAWSSTQAGGEVYSFQIMVGGPVGSLQLVVGDRAGEGGASLLAEDSLSLELTHGRPTKLAVQPGWKLMGGLKAIVKDLRVQVCDPYGNCCDTSLEVTLQPSALSRGEDSAAASVSAVGGNRIKLKKGTGLFEQVKVAAKSAGTYILTVGSATRKVALEAAEVGLELSKSNTLQKLALLAPTDSQTAGGSLILLAKVTTEDGAGLPAQVLAGSLRVYLEGPGAGSGLLLQPVMPETAAPSQLGSLSEVQFDTGSLELAGDYTATAEYMESRSEVLAAAPKQSDEQRKRSSAISLRVLPGAAVTITLDGAAGEQLSAGNGPDAQQRLILPRAAFQARDGFGNATTAEGASLRVSLTMAGDADNGAELPQLECQHAQPGEPLSLDANGRLFLGDVALRQGTGRSGASGQGVARLQLALEASGLMKEGGDVWQSVWTVSVLFSDDSARSARLQQLTSRRKQVADGIKRMEKAHGRAEQALQDALSRKEAVEAELAALWRDAAAQLGEAEPKVAGTSAEMEQQIQSLQAEIEAASGSGAAVREARYGEPRDSKGRHNPAVAAIQHCLKQGVQGVVGVMAHLVSVESDVIARVACNTTGSSFGTLVVQDASVRKALYKSLKAQKLRSPDMMALNMITTYRHETGDPIAFYEQVSELARQLHWEAMAGSDPGLCMRLPHTRVLQQLQRDRRPVDPECQLGANTWPPGFVGYLFNLVRPTKPNTRASIIYAILGSVMVFETLDQAEDYRSLLCTTLRSSCAAISTLDFRMITTNGIIRDVSARADWPAERFPYMIGSAAPGEQPRLLSFKAKLEALSRALPLLREAEQLGAQRGDAENELATAGAADSGEAAELRQELAEIDAELAEHEGADATAAGGRRKRGAAQADDGAGGKAPRRGRSRAGRHSAVADPCEVIQDSTDAAPVMGEDAGDDDDAHGSAADPPASPAGSALGDEAATVKGGGKKRRRRR